MMCGRGGTGRRATL